MSTLTWTNGPILNSNGNCSPRDKQSNDPDHPGDMRYQRWYPTSVALPGNLIATIGGTDEDETVGPDPTPDSVGARDAAVNSTTIHQAVISIYDEPGRRRCRCPPLP